MGGFMAIYRSKPFLKCVAILATVFMLGGCGTTAAGFAILGTTAAISHGVFSDTAVNLKEKNYAAADFLAGQMRHNKIPMDAVILVKPFTELNDSNITSPFGTQVAEGIGARLDELGYHMHLHEVALGGNTSLYLASQQTPRYVLKGAYDVHDHDVYMYIRLFDHRNGDTLARFDYVMPVSDDIRTLSEPETRVFRTK